MLLGQCGIGKNTTGPAPVRGPLALICHFAELELRERRHGKSPWLRIRNSTCTDKFTGNLQVTGAGGLVPRASLARSCACYKVEQLYV